MLQLPDPSWRDGIRSLYPDEFADLDALLSTVFRPGLVEQYPHIYNTQNAATLRVVVKDGQVVSHIGTQRRHASILGCNVKVASLGGVATHPDHRGKGYATALFADTVRACREDGVDFMIVSGYRKIYHRHGCRYVGRDWDFTLSRDRAPDFAAADLEIKAATDADVPALATLYRRESVRWLRPPDDFHNALVGYVSNRPAEILTVYDKGNLRAYAILQKRRPQEETAHLQLLEFAGDRHSLAGVLGHLVQSRDLEALKIHVMACDTLFHDLLTERGLSPQPANASGTTTLINFPQFMDRLRPHFAEILGQTAAANLSFRQRDDHLIFACGSDQVVAPDPGSAAQLIFGTVDHSEDTLLASGGQAAEALRQIFPIPALWYGVNYV